DKTTLILNEDKSKSVKIKIKGTLEIINKLKESDFIAEINLKDKKEGSYEEQPEVKLVTPNDSIEFEVLNKAKYTLSLK
ncbi:MAG: CdaR family protein, partial [Clostridium sp.]